MEGPWKVALYPSSFFLHMRKSLGTRLHARWIRSGTLKVACSHTTGFWATTYLSYRVTRLALIVVTWDIQKFEYLSFIYLHALLFLIVLVRRFLRPMGISGKSVGEQDRWSKNDGRYKSMVTTALHGPWAWFLVAILCHILHYVNKVERNW